MARPRLAFLVGLFLMGPIGAALASEAVGVAALPPVVVVETVPSAGDTAVDPATGKSASPSRNPCRPGKCGPG